MCTTARLSVDAFDVDDTKRVTWHDTSLIQGETILALSLSLIHEALGDVSCTIDKSVSMVLNLLLLLACQTLEVSDVEMSLLLGLLGTSLPNVGSKHLAARSKDQMSSCMMGLELCTSHGIDGAVDGLSNGVKVISKLLVDLVEHTFANLDAVSYFKNFVNTFDAQVTCVVLLTTRGRVEAALVKNNQVSLVIFELVSEDSNALTFEVHLFVVVKVYVASLRQVNRVVKNLLWRLHNLLLTSGDLVVEVTWGRGA